MQLPPDLGDGQRSRLTAATDRAGRLWRCDVDRNSLALSGGPVAERDLVPGERIYLYEIGPGDVWRTPTRPPGI